MSQYRAYFVPGAVDPLGLCQTACACIVESVTLVPQKNGVSQIGIHGVKTVFGRKESPIFGTQFEVDIKLKYVPSDVNRPCSLFWGENTSLVLANDNPYNLVKDQWVNTYPSYVPPAKRENGDNNLFPFYLQNQKHIRGDQACEKGGTTVNLTLKAPPLTRWKEYYYNWREKGRS